MLISYHLPTVFIPGSSPAENAEVLQSLVEELITLNLIHLKHHPNCPDMYSPAFGVVYRRTDEWMTIPSLWLNKYGDCKSLTAMRIAQLRKKNVVAKPVFRFQTNGNGTDYHILVQTGIDQFEDPSKKCGMRDDDPWAHIRPSPVAQTRLIGG